MILSTQNLAKLRTQPHRSVLYLSIYRPKTLFAARVTGTYNMGETEIDYYAPLTGTWQNTYPNMQVLVGSTQGGSEKGRVRMRASTGTYSVFAENNVIWQNGDYITYVDYVNIEAIFPKIIKNPANAEDVIFYKDGDIPYSNQNSIYGTFPNAGSHRAGFLETGSVAMYYTATGTYNMLGDSLTYSWAFEGGTPTGSTALTPGNIGYTSPGHYKTRLIVTSSSGASDTTYRYVSIYDRPEQGVNTPILQWEMSDLVGSRAEGGYTSKFKVWQDLGAIEPNALVVIFSDDWYGGEKISLGGNGQNNSKIFFVGYILKDTIQFNYKEGYAEFDVGSPTEVMKISEGFSVSCESKVTPSTWFQLKEMTVPKAIYHYLRWHSTVLNVTDFQYTGDDRLVQYFDTDRQSLFDAVNSFVAEGLIGETVSDRQGKIWAEISPVGYENPMSSIRAGLTIQKQDWMGEPNIIERRSSETSFIEMGGIVYNGAQTNTFQALLTNAPSFTPLYKGKSEKPHEGLILLSQNQLNQISGNYLATQNSQFEDVSLTMKGNYRNLDIAPQERLFLLISPSDNVLQKSTIGYPFRLTSMNWFYSAEQQFMYPEASFDQIATGTAGKTLIIPPEPPIVGFNYPPFNLPPIPSFTIPTVTAEQLSTTVLLLDSNKGFVWTKDFDSTSPTYQINNAGIDAAALTDPGRFSFFIAPNGSVWIMYNNPGTAEPAIYYAQSVDGFYYKVVDLADLQALYPTKSSWGIKAIGYDPSQPERIAFVAGGTSGFDDHACNFYIGDHTGFTQKVACNHVSDPASPSLVGNLTYDTVNKKWVLTSSNESGITDTTALTRFNFDGSSVELIKAYTTTPASRLVHIRARDEGQLFIRNFATNQIYFSVDNGTTLNLIGDGLLSQDPFNPQCNLAVSPDGRQLMGVWGVGQKGLSSDYGYTFTGLGNLPPGSTYAFAYAGGEDTKSKWIAARGIIRLSTDFGNTWLNREGNTNTILAPAPAIGQLAVWIGIKT